ncbi:Murein DD-endopeptidase MepM and murein hydrolase activator NlpD, contain LysM domain [Bradyrhizobium lablabi]|uniref:Murein DD-endopeptidase MepM and murein hydrolase activator NlpD, contain LysM domain n=1 Tax=Bradyrhizobium lablabi TaxID=722472 RepID=A0A1M7F9C9_9BRAD|nr:LysM peptidoglycan-binding domain-containing M23 family metallopeptidase [Bradyrhizobium lablabi]SHM00309.1 Murein DD-endopeptidase MepM and murein hydrolase activator NlpD, contain LysM domain [Bradyrhizobium lablabi]
MSLVELLCSRRVPHVAVLALISIGFAGCSADMSTRLSQAQNPFSNPYESQPEATGTVPAPAVERRELPQYARPQSQYQSQPLPPQVVAPRSYPTANGGVSGGGRGLASYAAPGQPIETTGSVAPRSVAATRAQGTTIIVGTSDTVDILARRYNVTPAAILQANGYKGPRALSPGQQLIIPHPAATVAAAPALAAPASKPVAVAAVPSVHVVNHGDTLLSIARRNHVSVAELAKANNINPHAKLKLGMKLTVPAAKTAAVAPAAPAAVATAQPAAALAPPATKLAAAIPAGPQQTARLAQATTKIEDIPAEAPVKAAEATGALPTFRWPVRGKVITSYGAKTNGKANDGINLAVPEGTPVKAAEDGVVAYSGNELKGYGNLVLVRHSNGYVTAYAHASELLVKRGDTIKRGQIIAKSGQSGEVGSPQLHFEIRKGSTPVDPLQFLNGA